MSDTEEPNRDPSEYTAADEADASSQKSNDIDTTATSADASSTELAGDDRDVPPDSGQPSTPSSQVPITTTESLRAESDRGQPKPATDLGDDTPAQPDQERKSDASGKIKGILAVVVCIVGVVVALTQLSGRDKGASDVTGADPDRQDEVLPGEGEAADFADREPENPQNDSASAATVALGVGDWTEAGFVGAIVKNVLGELGYKPSAPRAVGPEEAYNELAAGQLDVWTDAWVPAHEPYLEVELPDGATVGDDITTLGPTTPGGGVMGIFVTTEWAQGNGIETVEDVLAHPDAATLFDLTGDAIPDFYGCNPGWGCAETINAVIRERGWRISQYAGDYDASVKGAIDRADAGEPALVFTWLPSAYGSALGIAEGRFSLLGVADPDGADVAPATACLADPCAPGFEVDDLTIATTNQFIADHPDIAAVLEAIEVPQGDISAAVAAAAEGETLDAQAAAWIEQHREAVDMWVAAGN